MGYPRTWDEVLKYYGLKTREHAARVLDYYKLPRGSDERKAALRKNWIAAFGHDRCTYCAKTLAFNDHTMKERCSKGCRPDPLEAQEDHDFPISRMGPQPWDDPRYHGAGNIVPACRRCNTRKGATTGEEFRAKLARESDVRK